MKTLKHLTLTSFLSVLILGCSDNSAEKEINNLKAEIKRLKENKKFNLETPLNTTDKIIERYPAGEKKLLVTYAGSGSKEFVVRKRTYYRNGQMKEDENYNNFDLHGDYREYYKNGQISVWAPAKMLLDAKNLPNFDLQNPLPLSEWLANEFGAQYLTWIGDITNTNCSIKIETVSLN